ncbi:mechanosensitive ion channel family protein [Shewanella sp. C32]|uniref:Small-conductance mechanosensitive channel n=1 Tax=Shewanella electrica TaxID=515560 RepID=A0ABT2FLC5_9GAMM|nr:mechanosensitive ion channel family protein [Shewanella electrica]MCH1925567.1 mechanosensitive ion channel family protein [Shewanella electrica]MCS4557126.1 mechanosensitive ion channel family protein [Shewanella electrica]
MMTNIFIILLYVVAFVLVQRRISGLIYQFSKRKHMNATRTSLVSKAVSLILFVVMLSMTAISIGLGYQDVSLFVSSAFAVLGMALVAQWSILSNVTAGILIFFMFPYKLGDRIKIIDSDIDTTGTLEEVTLFHLVIKLDSGNTITYPNTLALTKPVMRLPRIPVPVAAELPAQQETSADTQANPSLSA